MAPKLHLCPYLIIWWPSLLTLKCFTLFPLTKVTTTYIERRHGIKIEILPWQASYSQLAFELWTSNFQKSSKLIFLGSLMPFPVRLLHSNSLFFLNTLYARQSACALAWLLVFTFAWKMLEPTCCPVLRNQKGGRATLTQWPDVSI